MEAAVASSGKQRFQRPLSWTIYVQASGFNALACLLCQIHFDRADMVTSLSLQGTHNGKSSAYREPGRRNLTKISPTRITEEVECMSGNGQLK